MLIVCPSCATSYDVDVASLQPTARQVRCVRCRTVWRAEPTRAEELLAAAGAIAPDRDVAQESMPRFAEEAAERRADVVRRAELQDHPADDETAAGQSLEALVEGPDAVAAIAENGVPSEAASDSGEVEAPPIAPVDLDEGQSSIDVEPDHASEQGDEPHQDIETYAARRRRRSPERKSLRWPLSHLQNGIVALLIIDAVLVGWRNDVVRVLPQTASFYAMLGLGVNLRGLVFEGVTTTTEQHEGGPILLVEGNIVNNTRNIVDVPRLKLAARNAAREEIYSWTAVPPRTTLPPGETVAFRTRLGSPPPEVRDVLVRFITRRDILSGTR
jgi:predicted Zn finger-like uncharacterized protein